jgi:hypothetical protein
MQIGQVPIQFVPDAVVNDTRAITAVAETGEALIPSLQPFAPPVPVVVDEPTATTWGMWAALGGLLIFAWFMASPRR